MKNYISQKSGVYLHKLTFLLHSIALFKAKYANKKGYPLFRDSIFLFILACLGAASAIVIFEPWNTPIKPILEITVGKTTVPTGQTRPEEMIKNARNRLKQPITLNGSEIQHTTNWAQLGAQVDLQTIDRLLIEFGKNNSPATIYNQKESDTPGVVNIPLPISLVSGAAVESLVTIKEIIDRRPTNAKFNFSENKIEPDLEGLSLNVYKTLEKLDEALAKGKSNVEMVIASVSAEVKKADLENINVSKIAGFYETPYSRMRKDRNRTHNVTLGASMLDGQVIMPGQLFSFNDILGDRSEARGFRYAPVIAAGTIVEGMGGGTCQVASTLYAASFFAGLVVEDRQPHSRPSSYIKLGLDATVSYPALDLKIRNPLKYPVVIHFTVNNGKARVEIRAKERPFAVTLLRKIIATQPFPIKVINDSKVPKGDEIITQLGVPGYTVRRYKVIERDKIAYRFQSMDKYPPTVQFIHKGTGNLAEIKKSGKKTPKPDGHKPYRASSSLRMVQGDNVWYESSHE